MVVLDDVHDGPFESSVSNPVFEFAEALPDFFKLIWIGRSLHESLRALRIPVVNLESFSAEKMVKALEGRLGERFSRPQMEAIAKIMDVANPSMMAQLFTVLESLK